MFVHKDMEQKGIRYFKDCKKGAHIKNVKKVTLSIQ